MSELVWGFVATAVALAVFLGWTTRELRRVGRVSPPPPGAGEDGDARATEDAT